MVAMELLPGLYPDVPLDNTVVVVVVVRVWSCFCLQTVLLQQHTIATIHTMMTTRLPTVMATDAVTPSDKKRFNKLVSVEKKKRKVSNSMNRT